MLYAFTCEKLFRGFGFKLFLLSSWFFFNELSIFWSITRCTLLSRVPRGGTVDRSEAVERDEYFSTIGVMIWIGAGAAWMVGWDFLKQFNWRILARVGKILKKRDPIPQNLTAKTEIIPNPEAGPKFFIQPPIFATKLT